MPAPAADAAQRRDVRIDVLTRELAFETAQYAQYSLAVPIVLMVIGGVTANFAAFFFGGFVLSAAFDWGADALERGLVISGVVLLASICLEVVAVVMMVSRISGRRPHARRIKEIKRELADYGVLASLDVSPVPSGAVLTGTFSF